MTSERIKTARYLLHATAVQTAANPGSQQLKKKNDTEETYSSSFPDSVILFCRGTAFPLDELYFPLWWQQKEWISKKCPCKEKLLLVEKYR
ncbi:hypothetical protein FF011L_30270 [Roseimaritima multifibrata]|uniref:Uncharacterized protein n=1 Tax=Roseimaritima multifibrata TaxID=1930274 RepID=A0A517MH90_9BACT|nr:hypothetical protein FF011L_30270 [Roseimaritima multifibrata]